MAIHYQCRHCQLDLGKIEEGTLTSTQLGFDHLNDMERKEMINYDSNGNIHVKVICEDCHEALDKNPDLHQLESFIQ